MFREISEQKGRGNEEFSRVPATITDTGCERDLNEDRYAVIESESGIAWLVCDGMGGVAGGELAAQLAIDVIKRDLENAPYKPTDVALKSSIFEANRVIVLRRQNPVFAGMGTTIVGALFNNQEVSIANVGDSRAYLVRETSIQQLTLDHTYVQELVEQGKIQPEEALDHPQAHILTRCIGSEPGLKIDCNKYWIWDVADSEPKDVLVLATDGLYSLVTESEIAETVSSMSIQNACVKLVELAKERGGFDNITLSLIPLNGQMRQSPPVGYKASMVNGNRGKINLKSATEAIQKYPKLKIINLVLTWIFLAAIFCALTAIIFTVWLEKR
jgi:PPM family protein phosphatase